MEAGDLSTMLQRMRAMAKAIPIYNMEPGDRPMVHRLMIVIAGVEGITIIREKGISKGVNHTCKRLIVFCV
jgi:hypothetical protein